MLGSDQIPAKLIHAGSKTLLCEINKLTNYIWEKEELPDQWNVYYCTSPQKW
jgi:hypothetical protein